MNKWKLIFISIIICLITFINNSYAVSLLANNMYTFRLITQNNDIVESIDFNTSWIIQDDKWIIPGYADGILERTKTGVIFYITPECDFSPCAKPVPIGIYTLFFDGWLTDGTRLIIDNAVNFDSVIEPCLSSPNCE